MDKKMFIGTWKLVSWETQTADGQIIYPFGNHPIGYITYTEDGYMSANIMRSNRLNLGVAFEELLRARQLLLKPWLLLIAGKYVKAIFRYFQASANYVSYGGRYEIQSEKVIHYVDISLIPDWTGTYLERTFKFVDNKLVLITPPMSGNAQYLTWERV
jgi:hypothetical protein